MTPSVPNPDTPTLGHCAGCGAPLTGPFCSRCGKAAGGGRCGSCQTPLTPGAQFCHKCGARAPVAGGSTGRERLAWGLAALAVVVAAVALLARGNAGPVTPDMGNAGNAGLQNGVPPLSQRAPDISSMSPRERFDRLWNRVVRAAEGGDSVTVIQFAPMALGAYGMLTPAETDADARYHAATIQLVIGDLDAVLAIADTLAAEAPGHLLAAVLRGEVADRRNDVPALNRSYRDFLANDEAEQRAGRTEYAEHKPVLDDFRTRARASIRP